MSSPSFGHGADVVFCRNGGPGLPCDHLREAHSCLVDHGYRVVAFEQLETGASDRSTDPALWTIGRYVEETETVRAALGLGKVHLLGHSWGGWLGIDYAVAHPEALRTLIVEDAVADMPHLISELDRLRGALGSETVAMMQRHEADGTIDHPEYLAVVTILNYRHVCWLADWPAPLKRSLDDLNMAPYETMQGPNEFLYVGNLKDWNRIPDLPGITVPVLITCGQHDELTPACASHMKRALPNARQTVFPNSSHMPFYEEPGAYHPVPPRLPRRQPGPGMTPYRTRRHRSRRRGIDPASGSYRGDGGNHPAASRTWVLTEKVSAGRLHRTA